MASLTQHNHGKRGVRILKVRRKSPRHEIAEFTVEVWLHNPGYAKVYTDGDNTGLVATDTIRNTCYIVAKRCECESPEQYCAALVKHFLGKYAFLTGAEARAEAITWERVKSDGRGHNHGFVRGSPEVSIAHVSQTRGGEAIVTSSLEGLVVLKTTKSGFAGFLRNEHTTLPETTERCMSTSVTARWSYVESTSTSTDFKRVREQVRNELFEHYYGPPVEGVYSKSVQETVHKMGTSVIARVPEVHDIFIHTPNVHYIPFDFARFPGMAFEDDVLVPTSEPSGTICCTITRTGSKPLGARAPKM